MYVVFIYYIPTNSLDGIVWYYLLAFFSISNCPICRILAPGILAPPTGAFVLSSPLVPLSPGSHFVGPYSGGTLYPLETISFLLSPTRADPASCHRVTHHDWSTFPMLDTYTVCLF
jgi:hypothetical protein